MMPLRAFARRLASDSRGAVVIETAIVAPTLILLSLGGFEVSNMVARQNELQSAAAEAAQIALAANPDTPEKIETVKGVVETSTGLPAEKITMSTVYRCQSGPTDYVTDETECDPDTVAWQYLKISMTDTYNPIWTNFGVGEAMTYRVVRTVLVAG